MVDRSVGGYHVPPSEAGTARAGVIEQRLADEREAQRRADSEAVLRAQEASERASRAQRAENERNRQNAEAARQRKALEPAKQHSARSSKPATAAPAEPGSMANFFGFTGAMAGALTAGTHAWREQSVIQVAGKSDAPFMEAVQGAIELGGPDIWMPTAIAAAVSGAFLYHLYKPLLALVALGAAGLVFSHGQAEGWF